MRTSKTAYYEQRDGAGELGPAACDGWLNCYDEEEMSGLLKN